MVATCRAAAVLSCLLLATSASAQVTTGDIVGRVTDESGAVLPGATVTVDNVGTHEIRTTVTSATGDYVVNLLPIGTYQVRVELESFRAQESRVDREAVSAFASMPGSRSGRYPTPCRSRPRRRSCKPIRPR